MRRFTILALTAAVALSSQSQVPADESAATPSGGIDYTRIDRSIRKEPVYAGAPLYALFLFGPASETRMWAVLDKSKADLAYYDVLHLDRDADGDLTEPGERIQGTYRKSMARAGMAMTITVGDLSVPGTNRVHEAFRISTIRKPGRKGIWFTMKWCGRETISGGAAPTGMDSTTWGVSPDQAPILRPTPEAPLAFSIWGADEVVLPRGRTTDVKFQVGSRGSGPDTLCHVDDEFLKPGENAIRVTLIAKDARGMRIEETTVTEDLAPC